MERIEGLDVGGLASHPILLSPSTPVSKVIGSLKQVGGYEVFLEGESKIGMVTIRDILNSSSITRVKAESLAVYVPKLKPVSLVREAARLMMEYRIRALPIVEDNSVTGCVTSMSIVNALKDMDFLNFKAADIMTGNPASLYEDEMVSKARQLMIRRRIDHLPILSRDGLEGVLTSSQLVYNMLQATETIDRNTMISEEQRKLEFPVKHIMDRYPLTCHPKDKISNVLERMEELNTSYALVRLWKEVQGIITYRDYMKIITEQLEKSGVPIYIVGLPDDPFEVEMARSKFRRAVEFLKKGLPYIEEAKSTIRTSHVGESNRRRFEVKASIITPKRVYNYSESGWELPVIYDALAEKMKKLLQRRRSKPHHR